jgi:hypothetical protein
MTYPGGVAFLSAYLQDSFGIESQNNSGTGKSYALWGAPNGGGARIDVSTGQLIGYDPDHWYFGSGGSITLDAEVFATSPLNPILSRRILFNGTFTDSALSRSHLTAGIDAYVLTGHIYGTLDPGLATLMNLPQGNYSGTIYDYAHGATTATPPGSMWGYGGIGFELDLSPVPTPEPSTGTLLITVVAGIGLVLRKSKAVKCSRQTHQDLSGNEHHLV